MFKSGLVILSGNAATSVMVLIRNLVIARLIPVADFGVAATFAIAVAVVEMASTLGLQQQIVQSKDGDDPRFQAALQGFQLLRGTIAGVALFLLAGIFADFMGVPEAAWAYQILALVPILNGLGHFDIYRMNRGMVFGPSVLIQAVPAVLTLFLAWPLAVWLEDYSVMLWVIMVQVIVMNGLSHLLAERPYQLVWDQAIMARSLRFGWPLLVNGILLFAVLQGDKVIVAGTMDATALAIFAMGTMLTFSPALMLAKSVHHLMLPLLSRAVGPAFERLAFVAIEASFLIGILLVAAMVMVGQPVVFYLLGAKYADLQPLLTWMALLYALRFIKVGPALVALAIGKTTNAMWYNLVRVAVFPLAWWVAVETGDLVYLIWVGLLGEMLGYIASLWLMLRSTDLRLAPMIPAHLGAGAVFALAAACAQWWPFSDFGVVMVMLAVFILSLWSLRHLRVLVSERIRS